MLRILLRLLLNSLIGAILVLLTLEIVVRVVLFIVLNGYLWTQIPPQYQEEMRALQFFSVMTDKKEYDPICFYVMSGGHFRGPQGQVEVGEKKDGELRVLCIGDSTTYGAGVVYESAYPFLLEKLLQKSYPGQPIHVLNAGILGASSRQIKRVFQLYLADYGPDIVLWRKGAALTDRYEVSQQIYSGFFRIFLARILYESRLFRVFCVGADIFTKKDVNGWSQAFANVVYTTLIDNGRSRELDASFNSDFSMVQHIAKEHHIPLIIAVDYIMRTVPARDCNEIRSDYEAYESKGISPVINTLPAFEKILSDYSVNVNALLVDQCHLTAWGNEILAKEIHDYIVKQRLIEQVISVNSAANTQ
jgi:lysophospholipase L1-like esterase